MCLCSAVVYLNGTIVYIVLLKNKVILHWNFLFNFENRQVPVTHRVENSIQFFASKSVYSELELTTSPFIQLCNPQTAEVFKLFFWPS